MLQMEATECGAAALAIILGYYGRYVSLEELRIACGVSRDGSKAINILKAAREFGLTARGAQIDDVAVLNQIPLPCILFWEFNHFIVLEEISTKNKVYINDPATGPRIITEDELGKSFTGIVLAFEPNEEFSPGGKPLSFINYLKNRLTGSWATFTFILLASFALIIPNITIPFFNKIFIDEIFIRGQDSWIAPLLTCMFALSLVQGVLIWLQLSQLLKLQVKLAISAISTSFWHILCLPVYFFTQRSAGDINQRLAANDSITELLGSGFSANLINLFSMFIYALIMFLLSWQLALIAVIAALINAGFLYFAANSIKNLSWRLSQERGKLFGFTMNGLQGIETIKASAMEDLFFQRWAGYHAKTINSQQYIAILERFLSLPPQFITALTQLIIICYGTLLIMNGALTIGSLIAFLFLQTSFNAPLLKLLDFCGHVQTLRGDIARLDDIEHHPVASRFMLDEEAQIPQQIRSDIEIKNVSFGYSKLDSPLLKNCSLSLPQGKSVAIVGATGCGKSTLSRLIAGLYQPWEGSIHIDGIDISTMNGKILEQLVGLVEQDSHLFSASLYDNLTLWKKDIPDETLFAALRDVDLLQVVEQKGGINLKVGTEGTNFSGGQQQRLEIARALIANPKILILDEATSALDPINEKLVYDNIKKRQFTLIIIAHRLSAIRDCDEIIVLQEGEIVQRGSHEELLQQSGLYKQLVTME